MIHNENNFNTNIKNNIIIFFFEIFSYYLLYHLIEKIISIFINLNCPLY